MQTNRFIAEDKIFNEKRRLRDAVVTVPFASDVKNTCAKANLGTDIDLAPCFQSNTLIQIWNEQHPIIHTWLLLSSVSICLLFAVFFIIQ